MRLYERNVLGFSPKRQLEIFGRGAFDFLDAEVKTRRGEGLFAGGGVSSTRIYSPD